MPPTTNWFTPLENHWGESRFSSQEAGHHRQRSVCRRLMLLYQAAGMPYKSPHKFRHGHAVYGLQHAQTMADYKAVSMNLIHDDIKITDEIYAPILSTELKDRIGHLSSNPANHRSENRRRHLLAYQILSWLKSWSWPRVGWLLE
jgi:integrase